MDPDAAGRLAYLDDCVSLLWPDAGSAEQSMIVLPSARAPRLLVPVRPVRAGVAAVIRYTAQQGVRDQVAAVALAGAVAAGYGRLLPAVRANGAARSDPGTESVDELLGALLGQRVLSSLALTRARSNRKPVLQVFDRAGHTIAFAKIGVSALARQLVDAEAGTLQALAAARLHCLDIPRVLQHAQWRGMSVLVTTALPRGRRPPRARPLGGASGLVAAMREVSAIDATACPSGMSQYLTGLRVRIAALGSEATEWDELLDEILDARELDQLPSGAWHGDWTSWNCAQRRGRLSVWDWERFTSPAPQGFDLLHYVLNDAVGAQQDRFARAVVTMISDAPQLLRPWQLRPAEARSIAVLYVLDVALRYQADDARLTDARGGTEEWALPAIRAVLRADRRGASSR